MQPSLRTFQKGRVEKRGGIDRIRGRLRRSCRRIPIETRSKPVRLPIRGSQCERETLMQNLLYLPVPMSFFVASAITTFIALAGLYLVRKRYPAEVLKENHEVTAIIFN